MSKPKQTNAPKPAKGWSDRNPSRLTIKKFNPETHRYEQRFDEANKRAYLVEVLIVKKAN